MVFAVVVSSLKQKTVRMAGNGWLEDELIFLDPFGMSFCGHLLKFLKERLTYSKKQDPLYRYVKNLAILLQ